MTDLASDRFAQLRSAIAALASALRVCSQADPIMHHVPDSSPRAKPHKGKPTKRVPTGTYALQLFPGGRVEGLSESVARTMAQRLTMAAHEVLRRERERLVASVREEILAISATGGLEACKRATSLISDLQAMDTIRFTANGYNDNWSVGSESPVSYPIKCTPEEREALMSALDLALRDAIKPAIEHLRARVAEAWKAVGCEPAA